MNKKLMYGFVALILLGVALAKPDIQISTNLNELSIVYPKNDFFMQDQPVMLHFHVFNSTGYIINSSDVDCMIHLYDYSNNHTLRVELENDDYDKDISLNSSYTSRIGIVPYNVWCNTTSEAGFVSGYFEVSETGHDTNTAGSGLLAIIALIPLFFGLFMVVGAATLGQQHAVLKWFMFLLSPMMIFVSMHYAMTGLVRYYGMVDLQKSIGSTTYWMGWLMFVLLSYIIIYGIWKAVEVMAEKKKERIEY